MGRCRQREHIAGDFLSPLLHGIGDSLDRLFALGLGPRGEDRRVVPFEIGGQDGREATVPLETPVDRGAIEIELDGRQIRGGHHRAGDLAIALRDLFRVVVGVGVEKGPDGETGDVVQHEHERSVLQGRVVTGGKQIRVELASAFATVREVAGAAGGRAIWRVSEEAEDVLDFCRFAPVTGPRGRYGKRERMRSRFVAQQCDRGWG